ncbi:MAG: S8 family serine peptidase, partial [Anaerolineae bacterium]|nr:S8 family serine peptidase [Anaerolineae bacterium]
MKKLVVTTLVLLVLVLAVSAPTTSSSAKESLIIQANSLETAVAVVEAYGGQVTQELAIINAVSANFPEGRLAAVQQDARVISVQADKSVEAAGIQSSSRSRRPQADFPEVMGVDEAWDARVNGKGVGVALVDSGINRLPGFRRNIVATYDALDNGPRLRDVYGHGTMMASLVANSTRDNNGYIGIAPKVDLIDVRVLDGEGKGNYTDIIEGLNWVLENKDKYNIRVVNLSVVGAVDSPYWADPLNMAVEALWDAGIVVLAASGNGGSAPLTVSVPGNDPYVITVGAFTDNYTPKDSSDDYITPFSGAGPTEVGFVKPDVVAPGAHMLVEGMPFSKWNREHRDSHVQG